MFARSTISQFQGQGTCIRKHVDLMDDRRLLWKNGDTYPPQGTHILRLPFQFKLPDILPPSCDYPCYLAGSQGRGTVGYFVEVVGKRSGLHRSRKASSVFPVIPWDTAGASVHAGLIVRGWSGNWRETRETKDIRKGFRGERSKVEVTVGYLVTLHTKCTEHSNQLSLPDVAGLPVQTPVPFTITIVTTTKPMYKTDLASNGSIFPSPPSRTEDVEFILERTCSINAKKNMELTFDHLFVTYLGGLGPKGKAEHDGGVVVERKENMWLPSTDNRGRKEMGRWRQEIIFKSFFNLTCIPTFATDTFSLQVRDGGNSS